MCDEMTPPDTRVFGVIFFFFQAEDGIRDADVTGVQTCALPISPPRARQGARQGATQGQPPRVRKARSGGRRTSPHPQRATEIGRASCRERVEISAVAGRLEKKNKKVA